MPQPERLFERRYATPITDIAESHSVKLFFDHAVFDSNQHQEALRLAVNIFTQLHPKVLEFQEAFAEDPDKQNLAKLIYAVNRTAVFSKPNPEGPQKFILTHRGTLLQQLNEFLNDPQGEPTTRDCIFPTVIMYQLIKDIPNVQAAITLTTEVAHPYTLVEFGTSERESKRISFTGNDNPEIRRNTISLFEWENKYTESFLKLALNWTGYNSLDMLDRFVIAHLLGKEDPLLYQYALDLFISQCQPTHPDHPLVSSAIQRRKNAFSA